MDQDYIEVLLSDISKSNSSEEKIHLLTILVVDLSKSNSEMLKQIESTNEAIKLSSLAISGQTGNIEKVIERLLKFEEGTINNTDMLAKAFEAINNNSLLINKLLEGAIRTEANIQKIHKRLP